MLPSGPVNQERRRFQRLGKPFDGNWRGASGGAVCRITDLSLGGCFVHALAMPTPGEETHVTINFGLEMSMIFVGTVMYVEPNIGFAVKFRGLTEEHAEAISRLIEALSKARDSGPPAT